VSGTAYRTDLYATTELGPFARRDAAVYELDPPHISHAGVTSFVIVAVNRPARMVDVFPAFDDGRMASWVPLNADKWDQHDAVGALKDLGYEVVTVDGRA
jgi:hypothetical protein